MDHLDTTHGRLCLPVFLPDATRAVVRTLDSADLEACGVQGLVVNAFHLGNHPGAGAVGAVGGLHAFMGWNRPVLCDSGGFQVYSLLSQSPKLGSVTRKGFHYRLEPGQDGKTLTPAGSIQRQLRMGSDIVVCLDHCTHPDAPADEQEASVEHTILWARACRKEFDRLTESRSTRPLLFAVVQGGGIEALRRRCAQELVAIGFDGYGFGGWPIDGEGQLHETVQLVAECLPPEAPKWALGIGKPEHVVTAAGWGYELFDCALPTRDARRGRLYAARSGMDAAGGGEGFERIYMLDDKHIRDDSPVDAHCDCLCCRRYSRAYLRHLFAIRDGLAFRLATIHNLRLYTRLMEWLRADQAG